ncbi:MAG: hypothetical protein WC871_02370 [Bacteroidales bacterium]|jgi:hypothetical protein
MAYTITIDGTDRTADVIAGSVVIEDVINDKTNICNLSLIDLSGSGTPATGDEIVITSTGGDTIFGGYITRVGIDSKQKTGVASIKIECVDYVWLLDRNLAHITYEDMTDAAIIADLVNTYCPGFGITTTNVIEGVTIDQISFNYIQISQCLRQICDLTGRNWYIDYAKDIHYFPLTTEAAPFDIDSTNNEYIDLTIEKDVTQLKNRVYVRGGTKLSDFTTYNEVGDGEKKVFVLPDKPHEVSVEVNSVGKTVGIKNVDTSGYDWYLNFQEKYIEQDADGTTLTTSDTLSITYKYDIPILVAVEDTASIEEYGQKEFAIFDKKITTTTAARDRATAELTDYAANIVEGSFSTYTAGFFSGQYLNISLTDYGVDDDYIVQSVRATSFGAGNFRYTVKIASAKTIGIIRFLIELLESNRNLIELDDNEVVDELFNLTDALLDDSLIEDLTIDSTGPYFTWVEESPGGTISTRMRWGMFQWG